MDKDYVLGFSLAPGIGPKGFQNLIRIFGSAQAAWNENESNLKNAGVGEKTFKKFEKFRKEFDFLEYSKKLKSAKVRFIPYSDKYYPKSLKKIENPPIGLFVKGNIDLLLSGNCIAVVGARKITTYGRDVTINLVNSLCSNKIIIVSGMALGVDGVAHKTVIDSNGKTIAVLGCGVDCPYPKENEKLYEEILDSGGLIISEYPLGMPANPGTFPARNRIIAGISLAVLVTEAAEDSGSLITAEEAIKQNKKVFAVPGPITSHMSRGALKLLKQGATLVASAEDIFASLKLSATGRSGGKTKIQDLGLSEIEKKILQIIENEEKTVDEISRLIKIPIAKLSITISQMELGGIVKSSNGKIRTA